MIAVSPHLDYVYIETYRGHQVRIWTDMIDFVALANERSELDHRDAMDVFLRLSELWGLSTEQQITLLGSPARSTFFKWKKEKPVLPADTLERISHLVSMYKALQILFTDADRSDAWLRRPNRAFDGRSALDVMLDGKVADIYRVRTYVDAQRGG